MCVDAKTDDTYEIEMLNKIRLTKWTESFLVGQDGGGTTIKRLKQLT